MQLILAYKLGLIPLALGLAHLKAFQLVALRPKLIEELQPVVMLMKKSTLISLTILAGLLAKKNVSSILLT